MTPAIVCDHPDDVASVRPLDDYILEVKFYDGVQGHVDLRGLIHAPDAGVFAALADADRFAAAHVEYGAVTWPGEIDLAPDVMYEQIKAHGRWVL